jgi:translation initiation factor 1 (eIF-1/SUI1)
MPRQRKPLLKELFIMTWKRDKLQKVAIAKERNELIGQLLQEKTKVLIHKNQRKRRKNTIVIVKNFNKMSIKNHNYLKNYRQMNNTYIY